VRSEIGTLTRRLLKLEEKAQKLAGGRIVVEIPGSQDNAIMEAIRATARFRTAQT
jgi:hypothetical protein